MDDGASVSVEGGPFENGQITSDVSRSEFVPVFPLTIELYPEYEPTSNYALLFEFKGDDYPDYYKAVDTSAGGPGIASAVELTSFKQWNKSAIMSTTTDSYYKVAVKPNTPYYISLDNDTEGSGAYMGDPSIEVSEPNIGQTDYSVDMRIYSLSGVTVDTNYDDDSYTGYCIYDRQLTAAAAAIGTDVMAPLNFVSAQYRGSGYGSAAGELTAFLDEGSSGTGCVYRVIYNSTSNTTTWSYQGTITL